MSDLNHATYYTARERQARAMAASALSPSLSAIHLELAERYAALAGEAEAATARPRLRLAYA